MNRHLPMIDPGDIGRPRWTLHNPGPDQYVETLTDPIRGYSATAASTALAKQTVFGVAVGGVYVPTGGTSFNLARYHTNLSQPRQLPNPDAFLFQGLSVAVHPSTTPNDANHFVAEEFITVALSDKDIRYVELQPFFLPGAGGTYVSGTYKGTLTVDAASVSNGWPHARNFYLLGEDVPHGAQILNQGLQFSLIEDPTQYQNTVHTTDAATTVPAGRGIEVFYHLIGQRRRSG